MKYEKSYGAVVYMKESDTIRYLLVKSKKNGHWDFLKGHVEDGETELETAQREVFEETGLKPEFDTEFTDVFRYSPKENVLKDAVFFLAESKQSEVLPQEIEISDYKWAEYEVALEILTYENSRDLLDMANKFLNK